MAQDFAGWRRLRSDPHADLDPWACDHLDDLVRLGDRGLAAVAGDTGVHLDVRADNLLIRPDGFVTVVDWPWAANGASWMDRLLLLLVDVDLYGGHDPDAPVSSHLGSVDQAVITATLAGLAGFFTDVARRPAVPGIPTVRAFQADQARSTRAWLRRRMTPPCT